MPQRGPSLPPPTPGPTQRSTAACRARESPSAYSREPSCRESDLTTAEAFGKALWRDGFQPSQSHQPLEGVAIEPVLPGLRGEVAVEQIEFPIDEFLGER